MNNSEQAFLAVLDAGRRRHQLRVAALVNAVYAIVGFEMTVAEAAGVLWKVDLAAATPAPLPHQLAYIDGASRCTACGKLGLDISITGQTVCAGSPPSAEPADMTEAESERLWNITRSLACD